MSVARQPQVILTGELADFDVSSLLSAFGLGRQLITLEILGESGDTDGHIVIKSGRVVSAVAGEQTGADAVRQLLSTDRPAHFRVLRESQEAQLAVGDAEAAVGTIAELTQSPGPSYGASDSERPPVPHTNGIRPSRTPATPRLSSRGSARVRVLEGSLSDVALPTLLGVLSSGRQYIELHVLDERAVTVGAIELKSGMLVGARTGAVHGLDALNQLLGSPDHYRFAVIRRRESPRHLTALARVSDLLARVTGPSFAPGFDEDPATAVVHGEPRDRRSRPEGLRTLPAKDVAVPVLDGNFSELDLPSLVQVVGSSRQHTRLRIFDDQRQLMGELQLKSGQVLRAEAREASGVTAVRRLLHSPRDFTFVVLRHPQASEPLESLGSINEVLAQASRSGPNSGLFHTHTQPLAASDAPAATGRVQLSATGTHDPVPLPPYPPGVRVNGFRVPGSWLPGAAIGAGLVLLGVGAAALFFRPLQGSTTTDVSSALTKPAPAVQPAPPVPEPPRPAAVSGETAAPAAQPAVAEVPATVGMFGPADGSPANLSKPAIASLQAVLRQLGYDTGPIDGVLGPRTHAAIKAFQSDESLIADGTLTASTRARLARRISGQ